MTLWSITARFSQHGHVIAENAPDTLVDFHTDRRNVYDSRDSEDTSEKTPNELRIGLFKAVHVSNVAEFLVHG